MKFILESRLNWYEKVLITGSNLWYLGEGMFGPLFAVFAERVGGNVLDITWAWAIYLIIRGLLTIIVGAYSDGPARKAKIMVAGYALFTIFTFCYIFVNSPEALFLVQGGLGIATAMATPTWSSLFSHYGSKKHSGYAWGIAGGMADLVLAISSLLGGLIVSYFSFTTLFVIMGIIQTIATVYQARILRGH
jgi:MFS family permease